MILRIERDRFTPNYTGGKLYVNGEYFCDTLEDTRREVKAAGKTCIWPAIYDLKMRFYSGLNERYKKKFGIHVGMMELQNVKDFTYIYFHPGNRPEDTEGCILVGNLNSQMGYLSNSTTAYQKLYNTVVQALLQNEKVIVEITELNPKVY